MKHVQRHSHPPPGEYGVSGADLLGEYEGAAAARGYTLYCPLLTCSLFYPRGPVEHLPLQIYGQSACFRCVLLAEKPGKAGSCAHEKRNV